MVPEIGGCVGGCVGVCVCAGLPIGNLCLPKLVLF